MDNKKPVHDNQTTKSNLFSELYAYKGEVTHLVTNMVTCSLQQQQNYFLCDWDKSALMSSRTNMYNEKYLSTAQ